MDDNANENTLGVESQEAMMVYFLGDFLCNISY